MRGHYRSVFMPHPSVGAVADIDVDKRLKKIQSDQSMNFFMLLAAVTLWGLAASNR